MPIAAPSHIETLRALIEGLTLEELREAHALLNDRIRQSERGQYQAHQAASRVVVDVKGQQIDERRAHPRFHADFVCRVVRHLDRGKGRGGFREARVVDISRAGAQIATRERFVKGEPVTLYLQPNAGLSKQVYGVVARCRKEADEWYIGIRYIDYGELATLCRGALDIDDLELEEGDVHDETDEQDEF